MKRSTILYNLKRSTIVYNIKSSTILYNIKMSRILYNIKRSTLQHKEEYNINLLFYFMSNWSFTELGCYISHVIIYTCSFLTWLLAHYKVLLSTQGQDCENCRYNTHVFHNYNAVRMGSISIGHFWTKNYWFQIFVSSTDLWGLGFSCLVCFEVSFWR